VCILEKWDLLSCTMLEMASHWYDSFIVRPTDLAEGE
jgi:hypothetical protein